MVASSRSTIEIIQRCRIQTQRLGGPPPCNSAIIGIYKDPNRVPIIHYSHYYRVGGPPEHKDVDPQSFAKGSKTEELQTAHYITLPETNMETHKGPCKDYSPSTRGLYGFPCSFGGVSFPFSFPLSQYYPNITLIVPLPLYQHDVRFTRILAIMPEML